MFLLCLPEVNEVRVVTVLPPHLHIVGDSMLRGISNIHKATVDMLPGANIARVTQHLDRMHFDIIIRMQVLLIWVGTNNHTSPLEKVKEDYVALFHVLRQRFSKKAIFFVGLLPRPRDVQVTQPWVTQVNRWLRSAVRRIGHRFIPLTHLVQTRQGVIDHSLYRDGLHLSPKGSLVVRDHLRNRLKALFPPHH